nr:MAG TPA: hypothetical protein [Caudoviricetes sp.]
MYLLLCYCELPLTKDLGFFKHESLAKYSSFHFQYFITCLHNVPL